MGIVKDSEATYTKPNNGCHYVLLSGLALASTFVIIAGYIFMHYVVVYNDEPYQLLNGMNFPDAPASFLTSYLIDIIGSACSYRMIVFKYLAWTLLWLSIVASGLYSFSITGSVRQSATITTCALFLGFTCRYWELLFGWDSFVIPVLTAIIITSNIYIRKQSIRSIVMLSVFSACLGMLRLPSLTVLAVVGCMIVTVNRHNGKAIIRDLTTYIVVSLVIYVLGVVSVYANIANFIDSLHSGMVGNHQFDVIVASYISDFKSILKSILIWIIGFAVIRWMTCRAKSTYIYLVATITSAILVLLLSHFSGICFRHIMLLAAVIAYITVYTGKRLTIALAFSVMLAFVSDVGTNLGLGKVCLLSIMPILITEALTTNSSKRALYSMIMAGLVLTVNGINEKYDLLYEDLQTMTFRDYQNDSPLCKLNGLGIPSQKRQELEKVALAVRESGVANQKICVAGEDTARYLYEYIFESTNSHLRHQWQKADWLDTDQYVTYIENIAQKHPDMLFIVIRSEDRTDSAVDRYLRNYRKSVNLTPEVTIYM